MAIFTWCFCRHAVLRFIVCFPLIISFPVLSAQQSSKTEIQKDLKPQQSSLHIPVNVSAVVLTAVVFDGKGNLVTGLTKENFHLREEGKPREISHFFSDQSPVNVVLIMETSQLIRGIENDFWNAVDDFLRSLRPKDYCALIVYDNRPRVAMDFTQDFQKISNEARMNLYFTGMNESCLHDTLAFSFDRMRDVQGKKAIVLLSTGADTFSKISYGKALDMAQAAGIPIYSVSMGQLTRTLNEGNYSQETYAELMMWDVRLKSLSSKSGGSAFLPRFVSEYPAVFRTINSYLRHQYTLVYQPLTPITEKKGRKIQLTAEADINGDNQPETLTIQYRDRIFSEDVLEQPPQRQKGKSKTDK